MSDLFENLALNGALKEEMTLNPALTLLTVGGDAAAFAEPELARRMVSVPQYVKDISPLAEGLRLMGRLAIVDLRGGDASRASGLRAVTNAVELRSALPFGEPLALVSRPRQRAGEPNARQETVKRLAEGANATEPQDERPDVIAPPADTPDAAQQQDERPDVIAPPADTPDAMEPQDERPEVIASPADSPDEAQPQDERPEVIAPPDDSPDGAQPPDERPEVIAPPDEAPQREVIERPRALTESPVEATVQDVALPASEASSPPLSGGAHDGRASVAVARVCETTRVSVHADMTEALRALKQRGEAGFPMTVAELVRLCADRACGDQICEITADEWGLDEIAPDAPDAGFALGCGRVNYRAVIVSGEQVARPIMTLSLSARGELAGAALFISRLRELLENPSLLIGG